MDCMISKGSKTPIVYRKILWVFLEVLFVTVLLLSGNGTIKTVQGLGFLSVPFMIIFGLINVYLIAKFHINKLRNKNNEKSN
jgi:choline-glycine betaine transporter